jgi:hypothetical protein
MTPDNSMVMGTPAKVVKEHNTEQVARRRKLILYVKIAPTLCLTEEKRYNVTHFQVARLQQGAAGSYPVTSVTFSTVFFLRVHNTVRHGPARGSSSTF